jgi:MerR family copper efflux transcriptional regulator
MFIGKAAELCGVSTKTIRYYESLGLLPAVERRGAYRVFTESDVRLIQLIKRVQQLGFPLSEVRDALIANRHSLPWEVVCELIARKQHDVEQEIARLSRIGEQLQQYRKDIQDCLACDPGCEPLLS